MRGLVSLTLLFALAACQAEPSDLNPEDLDDAILVDPGKADDFYSLSASEFRVSGTSTVTLEPRFANRTTAERSARVQELIAMKQIAFAYFLTSYLIEKEPKDANYGYGGLGGLAKVGDYEHANVRVMSGLTYAYDFSQVIAGQSNLMSKLPIVRRNNKTYFTLTIGTPSNDELDDLETDAQWFRQAPWKDWNPSRVEAARKTNVELEIKLEPPSKDAWFDYAAMLEDDVMRIDVHFGYDYHSEYHRKHPRALFAWLRDEAYFSTPVRTFDELTDRSGPFTRTVLVHGEPKTIEVRIFYPKTGANTDPNTAAGGERLEANLRDSFRDADVIVWNGHSGPFYGFALANWKTTSTGDFSYEEVATVEMPSERYQLVFADGCDTYHLGEAFARNPAKPGGAYVDIVTSTTFVEGDQPNSTINFLQHLIETDPRDNHRPRTARSLLTDLRAAVWSDALYGIHGLDDNPHLHPYAERQMMCEACTSNSQCGDGSICVGPRGSRHCGPACTADDGCGRGNRCQQIASSSSRAIYGSVCAPRTGGCP